MEETKLREEETRLRIWRSRRPEVAGQQRELYRETQGICRVAPLNLELGPYKGIHVRKLLHASERTP